MSKRWKPKAYASQIASGRAITNKTLWEAQTLPVECWTFDTWTFTPKRAVLTRRFSGSHWRLMHVHPATADRKQTCSVVRSGAFFLSYADCRRCIIDKRRASVKEDRQSLQWSEQGLASAIALPRTVQARRTRKRAARAGA